MTNTVVKILFGSHLYGTNTEKSDKDFKGVYLPSKEDCYLNRVSKSFSENSRSTKTHGEKNTKDDVDFEIYSLQYFLFNMGRSGDTTFLDMIHASRNCILETSDIWEFIRSNRNLFYTKNLKSYLGYCRTQAAKYGIKGSRLEESEKVVKFLEQFPPKIESCPARTSGIIQVQHRMKEIWDQLPTGEHIKKYEIENARSGDNRCYDVCGRKIMANTPLNEAIGIIQTFINNYGERAKLAKANEGIDWKAISHAFRVGYQMKSLYTYGDIVFPLQDKDFLIKLKMAELHYTNDGIAEKLEDLIEEVEILANKSNYPEQVNMDPWEKFLVNCYV
jgi:hypothetical protein